MDFGKVAALNLLSMTVMGAMGGHKTTWEPQQVRHFGTAQLYHLVMSVGMFMSASVPTNIAYRKYCFGLFMIGNFCFVAPMYYRAWTQKAPYPGMGPFGGICAMMGFAGLALL